MQCFLCKLEAESTPQSQGEAPGYHMRCPACLGFWIAATFTYRFTEPESRYPPEKLHRLAVAVQKLNLAGRTLPKFFGHDDVENVLLDVDKLL